MSAIRSLIITIGTVGALVFGAAFAASFLNPGLVEKIAKTLIRHQVEAKVREKIETIDTDFLSKKAGSILKKFDAEIAAAKRSLADGLPDTIARIVAKMANLDCECRQKIEKNIRDGFVWQIANASQAQERLALLIRTKYMETAVQLNREFRIFTGTNALVFALLACAPLIKRKAGVHLLPAAAVLVLAAVFTGYLHLFNQDWLHTLVFSDYVGFAYFGYLAIAFAFLSDILFNRARITTQLLNQCFSSLGNGLVLIPC